MYLGKQNYKMVNGNTQLPHNYISTSNPTIDVNPPILNMTWLNQTTGEIFVCSDNTIGANVWIGQMGTIVVDGDITSSLVYQMGSPSGTTVDALVGDDFTITTMHGYGVTNKKYQLAVNEYITCTDEFFDNDIYSVSVFASTGDLRGIGADSRRTIFSDGDNESRLEFDGEGKICFAVDSGSHTWPEISSTAGEIEEVTEYHIVATYDNGDAQIFINGSLEASGTLATTPSSSTSSTWIGRSGDSDRYLRGTIRDFRMYTRILATTDIQKLLLEGGCK